MSIEYFQIGSQKFDQFRADLTPDQLKDSDVLIDGAYVIQREVHQLRLSAGDRQIGYKVGCISKTIQESLQIYQPIYGRLYEKQVWSSSVGLPINDFQGLAIEGELAVKLNRAIVDVHNQEASVLDAVDSVFPVIELHHLESDQPLSAPTMIAQNAIHAGFVRSSYSKPVKKFPKQLDILIDGVGVAFVSGKECRETVVRSLRWLAEILSASPSQTGDCEIVLCGSVAPLFLLRSGGYIKVIVDESTFVECTIYS